MSDAQKQTPIKLQLTAQALAVLFPEGSQARVELQASCVREFAKRYVGQGLIDEPSEWFVENQLKEIANKLQSTVKAFEQRIETIIEQELLTSVGRASGFALPSKLETMMRNEVESVIEEFMTNKLATIMAETVQRKVDELVNTEAWSATTIARIEAQVRSRLLKQLAEADAANKG